MEKRAPRYTPELRSAVTFLIGEGAQEIWDNPDGAMPHSYAEATAAQEWVVAQLDKAERRQRKQDERRKGER